MSMPVNSVGIQWAFGEGADGGDSSLEDTGQGGTGWNVEKGKAREKASKKRQHSKQRPRAGKGITLRGGDDGRKAKRQWSHGASLPTHPMATPLLGRHALVSVSGSVPLPSL